MSDKDELEKAVQENLRLRRELGGEARKASGGIAFRLGWVLYWSCLALIAAWIAIFFWSGEDWGSTTAWIIYFSIPVLILYGLGRAFRYVLSGE